MITKTKNVQVFSPAATRIYQAAKRGITLRTNPSHVKRIIDKELDKHSLSKEKIKKEISDATAKAIGSEVKKAEKFFNDRIEELEKQVVDLKKDSENGAIKLQEKISILESEKKSLIDEAKYLVEDKEVLIAQLTDLKNKKPDQEEKVYTDPTSASDQKEKPAKGSLDDQDRPPNGPIEDAPISNQEEKPAKGKKK